MKFGVVGCTNNNNKREENGYWRGYAGEEVNGDEEYSYREIYYNSCLLSASR